MDERVYTLGVWRVRRGHEDEFISAWKALGDVFLSLPHPPGPGTLVRSTTDPQLFYSFGPWDRLAHVHDMRENPQAQAAIRSVIDLCTEATPGTYRVVAEVS